MAQKIKQHPFITAGIVVVIVSIVFILLIYTFGWNWTGFAGGVSKTTTTSTPQGQTTTTEMQPAKSFWDWLGLIAVLAIPVVVALYTAQQRKVSEKETRDNQHHATLQAYLYKMSELLLNGSLAKQTENGQSNPAYERGCLVARVLTITVLTQLDGRRVGYVFAFLREAELMSATKDDNAVSLKNADLHGVDWSKADLRLADLRGVNLSRANLSRAIFYNIPYVPRGFGGTILPDHANVSEADLRGANLSRAKYLDGHLEKALLKGATMRNGKKHS